MHRFKNNQLLDPCSIQERFRETLGKIFLVIFIIAFIAYWVATAEKPIQYSEKLGQKIYCDDISNGYLIGIAKDKLAIGTFTGSAGNRKLVYFDTVRTSLCTFNKTGSIKLMMKGTEQYWNNFRAESDKS